MSDGDIYKRSQRIKRNVERIKNLDKISDENKETLLDFKNFLLSQGLSDSRTNRYLYTWYRLAPHIDFDLYNPEKDDVIGLVGKLNQGKIKEKEMAPGTEKEYKKAVNKFFKDFLGSKKENIDGKQLTDFFTTTVKSSRTDPDRLPTPNVVKEMVKHATRLRDKAIIMTLWASAGRIGEILGLKWKDVKFTNDIAKVRFRDTKTGGSRTVPLRAGYLYLKELKESDHKSDNMEAFIFRSTTKDEQLSYSGINQVLKRTRKRTNIPDRIKTNPHAFRKGRATYLAAQGMNQAQLCEFGGWVQGSGEVAVYIRMAESDVEQGIREISGIEKREDETEKDLNPVKCQECKELNKFEAENCRECDATLKTSDLFTEVQIEEMKDELKTKMIEEDIGKSDEEIREAAKDLLRN